MGNVIGQSWGFLGQTATAPPPPPGGQPATMSAPLLWEPSGDPTGITDAANYAALTEGGNVNIRMARGKFYMPANYFVIGANGVEIDGSGGPGISTDDNSLDLGTVLVITGGTPNPAYTTYATAGILLIDQGPGVTGNPTRGTRLRDLWIDLTSAPASVDGIAAFGAVQAVELRNVGIRNPTGNGINWIKDGSASFAQPFPDGWSGYNVTVQAPAGYGYTGKCDDSEFVACRSHLHGIDGWNIQGLNNYLVACRGDNGTGFACTIDAQPPGGSSVGSPNVLIGFGSQANGAGGIHVTNTSASGTTQRAPVIIDGCMLAGDGTNGAGTEAGILVSGRNTVTISNTVVAVGNNVFSGGCPAYCLATATIGASSGKPLAISWISGFANYETAVLNDAAGVGAGIFLGPGLLTGQGLQPTSLSYYLAALVLASLTISGAFTTGGSMMSLTNTVTTASSPMLYTAAAAADAVAGIEVAADTNQRWKIDSNGKESWGPGNAGSDCFHSRQAAGIMQYTSCSLDIATGGKGLQVSESGTGPKQGTATLSGGTIVVSNVNVTSHSRILLTAQDNNTTGALRVSARTAGTSFTITSSNSGDSGLVAYEIFEQG